MFLIKSNAILKTSSSLKLDVSIEKLSLGNLAIVQDRVWTGLPSIIWRSNSFDDFIVSKNSNSKNNIGEKKEIKYKQINSYKPSGNLIYEEDLFNKMKIK